MATLNMHTDCMAVLGSFWSRLGPQPGNSGAMER